MIMDELFMQSNRRYFHHFHGVYDDMGNGSVLIAIISFKRKRPRSGWHIAELILAAPPRNGVKRVGAIDGFHQRSGPGRKHGPLHFGHHLVIKDDDIGAEEEFTVPEEDRAGQVEVQPKLQLVVRYAGNVFSPDIDGKIWVGAKDLKRI